MDVVFGRLHLLLLHHFVLVLCDFERESYIPKPLVFGGNEAGEEDVDALAHTEGHGDDAVAKSKSVGGGA
jgi:hypothetical protein